MKKSLIALAVAGAFAAPAFAATSNVDVYGVLNISVEDSDVDNVDLQVTSRQSYIGFKGSEDLGGGLKAIWQIETAIDTVPAGSDGVGGGGSIANRNTFVGLAGTWGTALMGRHDTPYKLSTAPLDPFADTIGDWNGNYGVNTTTATYSAPTLGMVGVDLVDNVHDHRSPSAIAYISPTWDGFHFAAALVATNTTVLDDDNTIDAYSLAAVYSNGPIYIGAGYQDVQGQLESDAWKIGGSYAFGDFKVGGVYENVGTGFNGDRDSWLVNGTWTMGAIVLKGEYGAVDYKDINVDGTKWVVGADYNLSKRTKAFIVYTSDDVDASGSNDDLDSAGWAIGVKHSF
jgi:predicted porin